ncbi:ninja-family protein AFP3-like [Bidens hawaiensis]|uniref:ninja-family protein AFP3-like n=1 Tax=Bidens hawaiensis TaxID=980011 RepID=UPI00404B13B4
MSDKAKHEMGNLLENFTGSEDPNRSNPDEEVELNLGLSFGGRFGVDKSKLIRSSSIAAILPVVKDDDVLGVKEKVGPTGSYVIRTASLPVETEDEWRKRKELQSLRRLAAKRRRSEKQRNLNKVEREEYVKAMGRVGSSVGPNLGSGKWDSGVATSDGSVPGSVESQASSESEASIASVQSSQDRTNQGGTSSSRSKAESSRPNNKGKEIKSSTMDMPCVFTDGPGGRRIDGILYKYGKDEEVKIMCVCHGSFLTPAEFVKHAGGTDVDHPLKHIVVNPNSNSYL